MAIVIPVTLEALRIASRAGLVAERKSAAARLADRLLNELVVTGQWRVSGQQGTFGQPSGNFQWTSRNEPWREPSVRLVSVEVTYLVQNEWHRVRLSTLVPDTAL
jgi:hypothetical protein